MGRKKQMQSLMFGKPGKIMKSGMKMFLHMVLTGINTTKKKLLSQRCALTVIIILRENHEPSGP